MKRFAISGDERRHWPAPASGKHLHRGHVNFVDIRTLLAIYLDRHKVGIEILGDSLVLEAFVLHHVTPVTSGITDGQENRLVLAFCQCKRLRPPGMPVHRVVGMLQQVGGILQYQAVGIKRPAVCIQVPGPGLVGIAL